MQHNLAHFNFDLAHLSRLSAHVRVMLMSNMLYNSIHYKSSVLTVATGVDFH